MFPIKNNLYVAYFEEKYGSTTIQNVVISKHENMQKAFNGEYDKDSIVMSKAQYDSLFAPLFKEISRLNHEVSDFNHSNNL